MKYFFYIIILCFFILNMEDSYGQAKGTRIENDSFLNFSYLMEQNKEVGYKTDYSCNSRLRVYGGRETPHWFFMAALRLPMMRGAYWYTVCGGTLITYKHVMTAAHCFVHPRFNKIKNILRVLAGTTKSDRYLIMEDASSQERRISFFYRHAEYDEKTFNKDLAVLLVETPFIKNDNVKPLRLIPHTEDVKVEIKEEDRCRIMGYGYTSKNKRASRLTTACVTIVESRNCTAHYSNMADQICAGTKQGDTCQGDSGGPLICQGYLVGISSFGGDCNEGPTAYTKLSTYIQTYSYYKKAMEVPAYHRKDSENNVSASICITFSSIVVVFIFD